MMVHFSYLALSIFFTFLLPVPRSGMEMIGYSIRSHELGTAMNALEKH